MFRNYLKTAFSVLVKNRFFSLINITGLTLGITACLLIMMYVINELSYENFQKKKDRIYRVALEWGSEGSKMKFAGVMPALAPAINTQLPEVELAVRLVKDFDAIIKDKNKQEIREPDFFFADSGVFKVFSFSLIEGNLKSVLADPYSVVISKTIAKKYFGSSDPLSQQLLYHDTPLKITGIMEDVPENTHLKCDFLVSYSSLKALGRSTDQPWNSWGDDLTYILLRKGGSLKNITPKLADLLKKNTGEWISARMKFIIQPLKDVYWDSEVRGRPGPTGNKAYVIIFFSAAVFVLLIACFNFLNLSISQYIGRIKEVAIRKTAGADKKSLIFQFMTESFVVIVISTIIAVFIFDGFYIRLYSYLGAKFVLQNSYFTVLSLIVISIVLIVGIIAGGYPAFYISRFNPIEILRKDSLGIRNKLTLRQILIMLQFTISIILLAGTIIIFRQLSFMKNSKQGFDKENVLIVNFPGQDQKIGDKYEVLRDELLKNPNVRYVSGAYTLPGVNSMMNISVTPFGASSDKSVNIQALPADYGFVKSLGLEITDGRDFDRQFSTDRLESVLLNETAVKSLGLVNPVGSKLMIPGEEFKKGVNVIGVVRDFHLQTFHKKINPLLIFMKRGMYVFLTIRVNPGNIKGTLDYIMSTWKNILPETKLNYRYLKDAYFELYDQEKKTGQILSVFTLLAMIISCLGLFGFASFVVSKRIKEVGIRKVLGARTQGISMLLSGQFIIWILASSLVACPITYFLAVRWLQNFAFRTDLRIWIFAVAVCFEIFLALLIISWLSWKTATRNPVEALRYE
ncbi:MAG TPA: ABC transporter permease [Bacteroidales bacterium]|nr:ABC transporter permease [Bacteroidales bacterium]